MEEVRKGNIIANGLESPVIRNAWMKTDWVGIAKPDIDPNKTAMARKQNLDLGLTTHERESLDHNGTEFDENIALLEDENKKLFEVNKTLSPDLQSIDNGITNNEN
jgi:capsid protein